MFFIKSYWKIFSIVFLSMLLTTNYFYCKYEILKLKNKINKISSKQIEKIFDINTKCLYQQMKERIDNAQIQYDTNTSTITF